MTLLRIATLWLGLLCAAHADDLHYPATAQPARSLNIEGALETSIFAPLLEAFHRTHPDIALTYRNFETSAIFARYRDRPQRPESDLVMSSAMPWQYWLANNGNAESLGTAIAPQWPAWARWRDELVGLSFEPIVIVYRREVAERLGVPDSHAALVNLLTTRREALKHRVVTYDPRSSDTGFAYAVEDARLSPQYWTLVSALGDVDAELVDNTFEMLAGLASGRYLIGYNVIGSYAYAAAANNPDLVVRVPSDYTLVNQRLALIPRHAAHPDTAREFLAFLTHAEGQRLVAARTPLGTLSPDVDAEHAAQALRAAYGDVVRPIQIGPGLLALVDPLKRDSLAARWQHEFERSQPTTAAPTSASDGESP